MATDHVAGMEHSAGNEPQESRTKIGVKDLVIQQIVIRITHIRYIKIDNLALYVLCGQPYSQEYPFGQLIRPHYSLRPLLIALRIAWRRRVTLSFLKMLFK